MPSPVKPAREGPSIMDVEFNEEDDDDEYNPEKDEEVSFHEFICLFHIFCIICTPISTVLNQSTFHCSHFRLSTCAI